MHLVFIDYRLHKLIYAQSHGLGWEFETVEPEPRQYSMGLGNDGFVQIALYEDGTKAVQYMTNNSGTWTKETAARLSPLFDDTQESPNPVISLTPDGMPIIVFKDHYFFKVASRENGVWGVEQITAEPIIVVDSMGVFHIALLGSNIVGVTWTQLFPGFWLPEVETQNYLSYGSGMPGNWNEEYRSINGSWDNLTLAVDSRSSAHMVWAKGYPLEIAYLSNKSGTWEESMVSGPEEDTGASGIVSADAEGNASIVYFDFNKYALRYATDESGSWVSESLIEPEWTQPRSHLALDRSGTAHIAVRDDGEQKITILNDIQNDWSETTVDIADEITTWRFAFAFDSENHIHLVAQSQDSILHITNGNGPFESSVIDTNNNSPVWSQGMALDNTGSLHLIYRRNYNTIDYGTNESGSWAFENIGESEDGCGAIALDDQGFIHGAFASQYGHPQEYLSYTSNRTGTWEITDLATEIHQSGDCFIGLDGNGSVHVSYEDVDLQTIYYLTNKSGSWVQETVAEDPSIIGFDYNMSVESNGTVHIVYSDKGTKYASNAGGSWLTQELLPDYFYPNGPSMALDSQGSIHLSLWAESDLLYTTFQASR